MAVKKRPDSEFPGYFRGDELYTLPEIEGRLRVTGWTLREAFRAGLKSRRVGRIKVVLGADLMEFIANLPVDGETDDEASDD